MKLREKNLLILVFAFLLSIMGANVTRAYTNVDVAFNFHDALTPYGTWVNVASYGNVWRPRVNADFVPYTNGHWIYTSYGPTWDGTEPWAWCAYHYGQWVFSPQFGWVWVPGYTYTPGRVVWATGADYIGWTPYVAGGPNVNFWVVVNRDRFGYNNYSNYVLRRNEVHDMFDRRVVRFQSGPLSRVEAERITRHPIRVVDVDVRQASADRRSVKLVLPKGHETTALREISNAQQRGQSKAVSAKKTNTEQVNQFSSSKQHSEVKPATNNKTFSKTSKNVISNKNAVSTQHKTEPKKAASSQHQAVSSHHLTEVKKAESKAATSHHQMEPKKIESKKVEVNSSSKRQSSKSMQQVPSSSAQKEHINSKEKPSTKEEAVTSNSKHHSEKSAKSKQSNKKRKPPQSH
jgi:hypothetical protein